jgi:hypothetical protein
VLYLQHLNDIIGFTVSNNDTLDTRVGCSKGSSNLQDTKMMRRLHMILQRMLMTINENNRSENNNEM